MKDSLEAFGAKPFALVQNLSSGLVTVFHDHDLTFLNKRFRENIGDEVKRLGFSLSQKINNVMVYVADGISPEKQELLNKYIKELIA